MNEPDEDWSLGVELEAWQKYPDGKVAAPERRLAFLSGAIFERNRKNKSECCRKGCDETPVICASHFEKAMHPIFDERDAHFLQRVAASYPEKSYERMRLLAMAKAME